MAAFRFIKNVCGLKSFLVVVPVSVSVSVSVPVVVIVIFC